MVVGKSLRRGPTSVVRRLSVTPGFGLYPSPSVDVAIAIDVERNKRAGTDLAIVGSPGPVAIAAASHSAGVKRGV